MKRSASSHLFHRKSSQQGKTYMSKPVLVIPLQAALQQRNAAASDMEYKTLQNIKT
jgi:hypothetical protein